MKRTALFCLLTLLLSNTYAQETNPDRMSPIALTVVKPTVKFNPFDGIIAGGYIDNGAFLNFTGPSISLTIKNSKLLLGMLPSLRYKEDHGLFKNAPITPNLGVGLTYCYKMIAVQVPFYYNAKTATANGRWNIGVGVGMRLKYK